MLSSEKRIKCSIPSNMHNQKNLQKAAPTRFDEEKIESWLPDLEFRLEFHHEVQKIAYVGDKTWEKWISNLGKPFYAKDAKFFHSAEGLELA
jgi:hypothetical protein